MILKFFSNWYYHFRCVWPGMSKLPKITSLLFLCKTLRKKWVMQLIFYMQISMKACYKLILKFLDGYGQAFPKFPKKASLQCLYNIPKIVGDEVDFFDADKHQSFLTIDFNTLGIKVFYNVTGMIMKTWRTWWWKWSRILKVPKVTSLQCLYNISKKKLWMEFSIFDVSYRFLMKVARHVQSTKKETLTDFKNLPSFHIVALTYLVLFYKKL